ncbi:hypothetical protein H9P43_001955 [Blastocladiella emersonii ATCC 22665]|nr:hypothetical protein H9P43_001955 [Blastocladiella emersonii ATCC 22665]
MPLFDEANVDLLMQWIQSKLANLCEADPKVLSEYVLALLRHDMSPVELRAFCVEQLSDFLANHTVNFVDMLFHSLGSQSYLPRAPTPPSPIRVQPPRVPAPLAQPVVQQQQQQPHYVVHVASPTRAGRLAQPQAFGVMEQGLGFVGAADRRSQLEQRFMRDQPDHRPQPQALPPRPQAFDMSRLGTRPGQRHQQQHQQHDQQHHDQQQHPRQFGPGRRRKTCWAFEADGTCPRGENCIFEHLTREEIEQRRMQDEAQRQQQQQHSGGYGDRDRDGSASGNGYPYPSSRGGYAGAPRRGGNTSGPNRFWSGGRVREPTNAVLVENVPAEHLSQTAITEYFARFGRIETVELPESGDRAIVTFASVDEATAAHSSPDPIFANRFIKVFFYDAAAAAASADGLDAPRHAHRDRPTFPSRHAGAAYTGFAYAYPPPGAAAPVAYDPYTGLPIPPPSEELVELVKKQTATLEKLNKMRTTVQEKLAAVAFDEAKAREFQGMVTQLNKQIDDLKLRLVTDPRTAPLVPHLLAEVAEEKKRAVLDRELELLSKRANGDGPTPDVAMSEASDGTAPAAPAAAPVKPKLRGGPPPAHPFAHAHPHAHAAPVQSWPAVTAKYSLDLRPTTVVVSSIPADAKDAVIKQFASYGDVDQVVDVPPTTDDGTIALSLKYKTRAQAEKAVGFGPSAPGIPPVAVAFKA